MSVSESVSENSVLEALSETDTTQGGNLPKRPFAEGRFDTDDGRARLIALASVAPAVSTDADYPLVLNTGRVRDHWHSMTRTARSPRLNSHIAEPFLQIHPADAARQRLQPDALVELESRHGSMIARLRLDPDQRPGSVFVPIHWNDSLAREARVDALVQPALDPVSGQPEFKHTPVRLRQPSWVWSGFVLSRTRPEVADARYQVAVNQSDHWRLELAGESDHEGR